MIHLKIIIIIFALFVIGCTDNDDKSKLNPPILSMDLPDSLTGGKISNSTRSKISSYSSSRAIEVDVPCSFLGTEDPDPFRNGYVTTRFLVSQIASWTCISDLVISLIDFTINDGDIHATDNIKNSANYKNDDPTHYQVTRNNNDNTYVKLFYGFETSQPPTATSNAGLVITWDRNNAGDVSGVLTLDTSEMDQEVDINEPVGMRLEFSQSSQKNVNEMYLIFDESNIDTTGMRVIVTQNKPTLINQDAFIIQARVDVKQQWVNVESISETPIINLYGITDEFGDGASSLLISDLAVALPLSDSNHLGDYIFDKVDNYYFTADSQSANWDWIDKTVSNSAYRASRTTESNGGSWVPFSPSLDLLIDAFELDSDYFTNQKCELPGDNCNDLMNAIFKDGFADQESNQGEDPDDWRSLAMENLNYLESIYPNGIDWTDTLLH